MCLKLRVLLSKHNRLSLKSPSVKRSFRTKDKHFILLSIRTPRTFRTLGHQAIRTLGHQDTSTPGQQECFSQEAKHYKNNKTLRLQYTLVHQDTRTVGYQHTDMWLAGREATGELLGILGHEYTRHYGKYQDTKLSQSSLPMEDLPEPLRAYLRTCGYLKQTNNENLKNPCQCMNITERY